MNSDNRTANKGARLKKPLFIKKGSIDLTFLITVLVILGVGLLMLFSASYSYADTNFGNSYKFIFQQSIYAIAGVAGMLFFSKVDYHRYMKLSWIVYGATIVMLILVYFMPAMEGVHRWIVIGSFSFQPSEIAKFAIVLLFSHLISINYNNMQTFSFSIGFLGFLLMIICALVVFETHLSATVLIFAIGGLLIFFGGAKLKYLFGVAGVGVAAAAVAIFSGVIGYGSDRLTYWLDPWADATGKGYQTIQSLMAIGSGGLMGRGIGNSMQKHLWVPEPHNDFIFSIVCEEIGLIGAMLIIGLFCFLVYRGAIIAKGASDKFGSLLAIGLVFQVGLQALLNIMVVTNTIPNTGISLPFFSYGGTSLIILLCEMGIVLSVSRYSSVTKQ